MIENQEFPASPPFKQAGAVKPILSAWLLAGTLDIAVASIYYPLAYGLRLIVLYRGIASGVLGAAAFSGGIRTAVLGLALHYLIALIWTSFFFFFFPLVRKLSRNISLNAAGYGIFVSCAMTFVVLPLSNVRHRSQPLNILHFAIDTAILIFTIGTPISTIIGKYYSRK
jgi:hypothetical protein